MTVVFTADGSQRFVAVPAATLELEHARIVWPAGADPGALDPAASAILDCFVEPILPVDLAADLVDAVGMEPDDAARLSAEMIAMFLGSGHLVPEGAKTLSASPLAYPPSAST